MKIFKKKSSGYMLPAAIVMVSIMVIITSSLLSNSGFLSNSQYSAAAKIKSDSLARSGLENITFLLRNLSIETKASGTLCLFLPRIGGDGACDSANADLTPTTADFESLPFSNWLSLPDEINDAENFSPEEQDANQCGISGSFSGKDSWPADLIRNLATTFYISDKGQEVDGITKTSSLLETQNLGSIADADLDPTNNGFLLETWIYLTEDMSGYPKYIDIANKLPDDCSIENAYNSGILLKGGGGILSGNYYPPSGENGCQPTSEQVSVSSSKNIPVGIWTHVFFSVNQDILRIGMTCNSQSMDIGKNNSWRTSSGNIDTSSDYDIDSNFNNDFSDACNNGETMYYESNNTANYLDPSPNGGYAYSSNFIGRSNNPNQPFANVIFHNTRIWKRALTKDEIQENISNDLENLSLTTSISGSNSAILDNPFLKSNTRISPRYDHGTHFLRFFSVIDNDNPNNPSNSSFPFTFRIMSCAWAKNEKLPSISTFSSTLRYGVTDDGRPVITNIKRY